MGFREWRTKRSMRDPVRGEFRLSGEYFAHPGSSSFREMLTGVVSAPGVPPTPGEHLDDGSGRRIGHDVLPVLVDRAEPTRFVILWDEIPKPDFQAQARQQADEAAARMRSDRGSDGRPAPAAEVYVDDGSTGAPIPEWARQMITELNVGDLTVTEGETYTHVIDLTHGHLSAAEAAHLCIVGRAATATLISVTDVRVPQAALPSATASLCDLVLRVTRPDGGTYEAATRLGFRDAQRRAAIAQLGAVLPIRIDLDDETRVAVDVDAYNAQHPER